MNLNVWNDYVWNGCPSDLIEGIKHEVNVPVSSETNNVVTRIFLSLPYIKSKEIATLKTVKVINNFFPDKTRLAIVFKTLKSSQLFPNKDKIPARLISGVVYKYSCEQCSSCYIGETRRHLCTRVNEHISGKPIPTEVSKHCHAPKVENFSIISRTKFTKIAESLAIKNVGENSLLNEQESSIFLNLF